MTTNHIITKIYEAFQTLSWVCGESGGVVSA
jgi:hypothetical protein